MLETVAAGTRTPDLGGHAGTTEFTDAVIDADRAASSRLAPASEAGGYDRAGPLLGERTLGSRERDLGGASGATLDRIPVSDRSRTHPSDRYDRALR